MSESERKLAAALERVGAWRVEVFDATQPQARTWHIERTRAGSQEPVIVRLCDPISSTAEALIAIRDGRGTGCSDAHAWKTARPSGASLRFGLGLPGAYAVVAHPNLEDPGW